MAWLQSLLERSVLHSQLRKNAYIRDAIFLVSILAIALILSIQQIELPGLQKDEAWSIWVKEFVDGKIGLESLHGSAYTGPINLYVLIPFIYCLGLSVFSIRFANIFYSLIVIVLTFYLAKELCGRRVGYLTALLITFFPTFIFASRTGLHSQFLIVVFSTATLLFLSMWAKRGQDRFLYLGCAMIGLGMATKILFLWLVLALIVVGCVFKIRLPRTKSIVLAGIIFSLSASPFIYHDVMTLRTPRYIMANFPTTSYGLSNLNVFQNLLIRLSDLQSLLDGSSYSIESGDAHTNHFYTVLFLFATIATVMAIFSSKTTSNEKKSMALPLLLISIILPASIFTVTSLSTPHLLILLPLPQLVIGKALVFIADDLNTEKINRRTRRLIIAATLITLISFDLGVVSGYYRSLERTGGTGNFSDAIYDLADYLQEHEIDRPIAVDWGFDQQVAFLTNEKVWPVEIFGYPGYTSDEEFIAILKHLFDNPNNFYLFHAPEYTNFPRYDLFVKVAVQMNKSVVLSKTFHQRDGRPVILVYRIAGHYDEINIGSSKTHPVSMPFTLLNKFSYLWIEAENPSVSIGDADNEKIDRRYGAPSGMYHRWMKGNGTYSQYNFNVSSADEYSIWVRIGGYAPIGFELDGKKLAVTQPFDPHFIWYSLGATYLSELDHNIRAYATGDGYSICDAILLIRDKGYDPNISLGLHIDGWGRTEFDQMDKGGYYVWQDDSGWHIRISGRVGRELKINIRTIKSITNLATCNIENLTLNKDAKGFSFSGFVINEAQIDFQTESAWLTFELA